MLQGGERDTVKCDILRQRSGGDVKIIKKMCDIIYGQNPKSNFRCILEHNENDILVFLVAIL